MINNWENIEPITNVYNGDWVCVLYFHHKPYFKTMQLSYGFLHSYTTIYPSVIFFPIFINESILKENKFEIIQHTNDGCIAEYKCGLIKEGGRQTQILIQIVLKTRLSKNDESHILICEDDEVKVSLSIKYIHELQHMLDICGLPGYKIIQISNFTQTILNKDYEDSYSNYQKNVKQELSIEQITRLTSDNANSIIEPLQLFK